MTTKQTQHQDRVKAPQKGRTKPRRAARKTVWDDAEIVVDIKYTEPGTPLDERLRAEQTQAFLDLLSTEVARRS